MFDLKTKILIVDDMSIVRKIVTKSLKEIGFSEFVEAQDGNEAWSVLSNANPPVELILSDWNMPNCTGLDFLKKVRADEKFKALPFFMLTAETSEEQKGMAVKEGVSNFIEKPFTKEKLTERLELVYQNLKV
jgi:two-component system chemotaxis response regulator CheY